jgi:hypothetical protein
MIRLGRAAAPPALLTLRATPEGTAPPPPSRTSAPRRSTPRSASRAKSETFPVGAFYCFVRVQLFVQFVVQLIALHCFVQSFRTVSGDCLSLLPPAHAPPPPPLSHQVRRAGPRQRKRILLTQPRGQSVPPFHDARGQEHRVPLQRSARAVRGVSRDAHRRLCAAAGQPELGGLEQGGGGQGASRERAEHRRLRHRPPLLCRVRAGATHLRHRRLPQLRVVPLLRELQRNDVSERLPRLWRHLSHPAGALCVRACPERLCRPLSSPS